MRLHHADGTTVHVAYCTNVHAGDTLDEVLAHLDRFVLPVRHHVGTDLLGVGLGQRAAEDGEVLAEDEDHPAVDRAVAGHHPVARDGLVGHAEVGAAVALEHVPFLEGIGVEQELDAFPGRELALGVLRVDALLAAAQPGGTSFLVKPADDVIHEAPRRVDTDPGQGRGGA